MKVLVAGTWRRKEAEEVAGIARELGRAIAEAGHVLHTGAGTGISSFVVEGYREGDGEKYIAYLPDENVMKNVGEELGPKPDKIIMTNYDYPKRNVKMVKESDAVIALLGGLGTLTEIIHAVKDYDKKVAVIDVGELPSWIRNIPELESKVLMTDSVEEAVKYLE